MSNRIAAILAGSALAALASPAFAQFGPPAELAEGEGKALVEGVCTACHLANNIVYSNGYTAEGWELITASMVDLSASPAHDTIVAYLAENYPPNGTRDATPVDGPLEIEFTGEWKTPKLGARPRDPVEAPDGMIWYVGQRGNTIGRINPETDEIDEWDLPPETMAHSVTIHDDGGVWYLGNGNGTIGKFDPETGQAQVFEMPDPEARDPHTGEFDRDGTFWFTLQQSNMIGRFDPATEQIDLVTATSPNSRPYGIKIADDGTVWVARNGNGGGLYKVDPDTMALTEYRLPGEDSTTRRFDIAENGMIWLDNSAGGKIASFDPETEEFTQWDSPSGPGSHPYGMEVVDGIVWYNESGTRPDLLVRFDPASETFQSWKIPSGPDGIGAGINRHMRPTADGDLLIHQDATNRIFRVDIPEPGEDSAAAGAPDSEG